MSKYIDRKWSRVMRELPYRQEPYSKKNWGNGLHSLCSYQGKLKPAIAHFLVNTFVPQKGKVLDPFSGVGTIPFEAALNGKKSWGIDISPLAYYVSSAKLHMTTKKDCDAIIDRLETFINSFRVDQETISSNASFGFNKTLGDYYDPQTFREILSARQFFRNNKPRTAAEFLIISSLLHILHGNRPYALSRRSHPIVPYAPTGEFIYKNLVEKVKEKVYKSLDINLTPKFQEGTMYLGDSTESWPEEINDLDAVITSPPFFDSTRFYMANWIRLWFTGWDDTSFNTEPLKYVDEKQKISFDIYNNVFANARERLKDGGYFVMHLGKSDKCNMGDILKKRCLRWFTHAKLYIENVSDCETFGIKDIGTVSEHQYLIMY